MPRSCQLCPDAPKHMHMSLCLFCDGGMSSQDGSPDAAVHTNPQSLVVDTCLLINQCHSRQSNHLNASIAIQCITASVNITQNTQDTTRDNILPPYSPFHSQCKATQLNQEKWGVIKGKDKVRRGPNEERTFFRMQCERCLEFIYIVAVAPGRHFNVDY